MVVDQDSSGNRHPKVVFWGTYRREGVMSWAGPWIPAGDFGDTRWRPTGTGGPSRISDRADYRAGSHSRNRQTEKTLPLPGHEAGCLQRAFRIGNPDARPRVTSTRCSQLRAAVMIDDRNEDRCVGSGPPAPRCILSLYHLRMQNARGVNALKFVISLISTVSSTM